MEKKMKMSVSVNLKDWYYHTLKMYEFNRRIYTSNDGFFTSKEKEEAKIEMRKYDYALKICNNCMGEKQRGDLRWQAVAHADSEFYKYRRSKKEKTE